LTIINLKKNLMKKIYFLLFVASTTFGIAQNLVVNPTFANGVNSWSATGSGYALPTPVTNDGQDDSFSVKYIATAITGFDQKFNVVAGSTVSVSFWYKVARTDGTAAGNTARIWSSFTNPSSATPTTAINPPGTNGTTDDPLRSNNGYLPQASTWTQVTIASQVPTGATVFTLQFRAYSGATVSFDNISFSSPGATVLSNSLFNEIAGLNVYPNPVSNGKLYITSENSNEKTVAVYDILGKQIINQIITNEVVNVSALNAGIYVIKITEDGKTATRKLVVR
jgi:hypothetical protein